MLGIKTFSFIGIHLHTDDLHSLAVHIAEKHIIYIRNLISGINTHTMYIYIIYTHTTMRCAADKTEQRIRIREGEEHEMKYKKRIGKSVCMC